MTRSIFAFAAVLIACGPPKPSVTVPAPVVVEAPRVEPPKVTALEPPQPALRLPRNFVPTQYTARLAIDPGKNGFDGTIQIAGTVAERPSVLWLHGRHLTIAR